jgi:hypothetical protein
MPLWERAWSGRRSDDELKGDAFIQKTRVIVNVHREQARSHRVQRPLATIERLPKLRPAPRLPAYNPSV